MAKFALGQNIQRLEDESLLRGAGRYADDVLLRDALYAQIVRSPHAHARITRIRLDEAARMPGVAAVLTGRDVSADGLGDMPCFVPVTNRDGSPRKDTPRPILAKETVRHVGDPVAVVIARTLLQARDAAEKVEVDYEALPAVVDTRKGEEAFDIDLGGSRAIVDAAIAKAAHVTRVELVNNRLVANPMEPRAALAEYDPASGRTTLHTPCQGPGHLHGQIAGILNAGPETLRVLSGNVGGAFGMKIFLHPEQPMVVWAARRLKKSVRWTAERGESFVSDNQGRDNYTVVELATDKDARFTALRVTTWANMGAYLSNFAPFIPQLAAPTLSGVYRIPQIALNIKGNLTHTLPVDAYRGAGRPEAMYLLERAVDAAARELGLAPDELRRRNFIGPDEMPYQSAVGERYDSGDFGAIMEKAMKNADWSSFRARREQSKAKGRRRGLGLAMYIERCGGGDPDTIRATVEPGGKVNVFSGMQDNGQGHTTTLTQLASHQLGIDAGSIRIVQGDTDVIPPGGLTGGSRMLAIGGVALGVALEEVIRKGKEEAARRLEASAGDIEYREGEFRIAGTDRRVGLFELGKLEATHTHAPESSTYPNGCHICEVEVDPESGESRIERYTIVDDFGRAMNPLLLEGQVHGGTVQGIGQALFEHTVYDEESGQLLSGSFMDYALPRADDLPSLACDFHHVACTTNPLGVKGSGEAGAVGAPAAVVNAIVDALGVRHLDMPATPQNVWRAARRASP